MASKKRGVTDTVVEVTTPGGVLPFDYQTWTAARQVWIRAGRRGGPIELFFMTTEGTLTEQMRATLVEILATARAGFFTTQVSWPDDELLVLLEEWKVPHRHTTDSSDWVRLGKKNLAPWGAPGAPIVPTFGAVPAFERAASMLEQIAKSPSPITWRVVGPRYPFERR